MQKLASLIIAFYPTLLLYRGLFFIEKLVVAENATGIFFNRLAIFLVLLILIFFIVNRIVSLTYARGMIQPLRALFFTVAILGLSILVLYHIIPIGDVYTLPYQLDKFFTSDLSTALWLIIPLLVLFI